MHASSSHKAGLAVLSVNFHTKSRNHHIRIVNRVLQAAITILATPSTNIRRQVPQAALVSSLRKGVSVPFALVSSPATLSASTSDVELVVVPRLLLCKDFQQH